MQGKTVLVIMLFALGFLGWAVAELVIFANLVTVY